MHVCFVDCRFFSKSTFSKNSFTNTIRVSNSLDPDLARHFVGPDLGPNCLQRLSADDFDIVCHQNVIQINSPEPGDNSEEILLSFVQPGNNRIARPTD